jgi:hypothetical protein
LELEEVLTNEVVRFLETFEWTSFNSVLMKTSQSPMRYPWSKDLEASRDLNDQPPFPRPPVFAKAMTGRPVFADLRRSPILRSLSYEGQEETTGRPVWPNGCFRSLTLAHVGGRVPWPLRLPSRLDIQQVADEVILLTAFPVGGASRAVV